MKIQETGQGIVIEILVKPKSKQFQAKIEDDRIVVFCREAPMKGKVNRELTKEFSRLFKRRVQIISGFTSRQKKLLIADVNVEEVREILSAISQSRLCD
ncbi:MAG: YggU family protein [Candidatus Bathyarchaeota archaeon]|nr:MAG: YggU family protein [Candidatus Bathyarchaeota archaeon]